jgi:Putative transposase
LVRYCARPALAHDRLTKDDDGHYLLRLKLPWRDGTTHLSFEPIELMERLAAQIPKPRINLVLYAGVLAPHAKRRADVVRYGECEQLEQRGGWGSAGAAQRLLRRRLRWPERDLDTALAVGARQVLLPSSGERAAGVDRLGRTSILGHVELLKLDDGQGRGPPE